MISREKKSILAAQKFYQQKQLGHSPIAACQAY